MSKVLKLNVSYLGRHGGDVDETLILPLEVNGVLFKEIPTDTTLEEEVSLGEIEGKHSDCYGDLRVDVVNIDELSEKEISDLIKESNFGSFEVFFEGMEIEHYDYTEGESNVDARELLNKYGVDKDSYGVQTGNLYNNFIDDLKKEHVKTFKTIVVNEADYKKALNLMNVSEIKVFQ